MAQRQAYEGCRIPHPIRDYQLEAFELEAESVLRHVREARQIVSEQVPTTARLLIIDLSLGRPELQESDFHSPQLKRELLELQYGCDQAVCGESFRHMVGFEPGDPRVEIWHVASDPNRRFRLPDAWIATGGDAMPSELETGGPNAEWLRAGLQAMQNLTELKVPGVAICLGHQLYNLGAGARVGRFSCKREIGSVEIHAAATWQPRLLHDFWDAEGNCRITAVHSETVFHRPPGRGAAHLASNDYCPYQGGAFKLDEVSLREADANDGLIVTLQNHPEMLARMLQLLRDTWYDQCIAEGVDLDEMVFRDTAAARTLWLRFAELLGRRALKRGA